MTAAHPALDPHAPAPAAAPTPATATPHPLDHPVHAALTGPQAGIAERRGRVLRYPEQVSPWLALPEDPGADDWADLAALVGAGGAFALAATAEPTPPAGWAETFRVPGVQLVDDHVQARHDEEAVPLGPADVPEMLDLVERTRPGPFLARTVELGGYVGIRRGGRLVAMAGERLRPSGYAEISGVCTDPAHRGQGLAGRLVLAVSAGIRDRGDVPFLHTGAANTGAIRLYETLGFGLRRRLTFVGFQVPAGA